MAHSIDSVEKIAVTTTAKDIAVNGRKFMIQNLASDQTVYFKEKKGTAATAANGFCVPASTTLDQVLRAETLSIVGSGSADVRIIYFNEV
mgnify:CR=1 FL=1